MQVGLKKLCREKRGALLFLLLMTCFRSAVADWNHVPSGSMQPTIVEGDRILVNKMAYDLRLPFTHLSLLRIADPERGDIVVFDSDASGKRLVKRLVGLPGDVVALDHNILSINGAAAAYRVVGSTKLTTDSLERLPGLEHLVRVHKRGSALSSFRPVRIPQGYYLAMGDNRDNSADSRVIGLVPRDEIVGRARSVVMSLDPGNHYLPRPDRFFHDL
jgi:signal peptidase I